jgi:hypothetical protein
MEPERKPTIRIKIEGRSAGASMDKLAAVLSNATKFLKMLSVDLGEPSEEWVAGEFVNGSVGWLSENRRFQSCDLWERALHETASGSVNDGEINLRIRRETRLQYFKIGLDDDDMEKVTIGISRNGDSNNLVFYPVRRSAAADFDPAIPLAFKYHGEIQARVHAFYKGSKRPKLVVRELSTKQLVNCFFRPDMYEHAVATLEEKDAVLFVEGEVSEDSETGYITDIEVSDFHLAPEFDAAEMESLIGSFAGTFLRDSDWFDISPA